MDKKCCRQNDKTSCCPQPCATKRGPMGLVGPIGPTGPQGAMGPTGATGKDGASVEVRSTFTLDPIEDARVQSTKLDDKVVLDFFIPRGEDGLSERVFAGNTQVVENVDETRIVDRYENSTHFLDFFIPRGSPGERGERGPQGEQGETGERGEQGPIGPIGPKGEQGARGEIGPQGPQGVQGLVGPQGPEGQVGPTGPKGEQGEVGPRGLPGEIGISEHISIDGTETLEPGEEAQVMDDFERYVHHLTFYIPKGDAGPQGQTGEKGPQGDVGPKGEQGETGAVGPQGPQGLQGVAGPPGLTPNINATIYNNVQQTISNQSPIDMPDTEINNGLRVENNGLVVPTTGTYLISFSINNSLQATTGDYVFVAVNGAQVNASRRPLTASTNTSATFATVLNKNDIITLATNVSSGRTITSASAPSAVLTVMLIAT